MQRVGFIGLGAMGLGMCENLIAAGFHVCGYDVDAASVEALVNAGGQAAPSPEATAKDATVLAICVFNEEQVERILCDSPVLSMLPGGSTIIMHTTMAPDATAQFAADAVRRGFHYLDAPITGGKKGADEGTLTSIVSGSDEAFAKAHPILNAMSAHIVRIGDQAGAASTVKMINQLLAGVHLAATAEALSLAAKAGADPNAVYEVITRGAGNSNMFESRAVDMIRGDFPVNGVLGIFAKDLAIVAQTAQALDFPIPVAQSAMAQFAAAIEAGHGTDADSTVVGVYERAANVNVAEQASRFTKRET
ncbi:MAG: NAD(P)-dependent oxidoreductase [Gammaproteobacteria bacterium]|nr:NAD(P)-dependent oxidoreductase [Gammaproteobacteria bacterium]